MTLPQTPLRVLFLMGQSRHDVLRIATREIAATFEEAGHTVSILDLTLDGGIEHLATLLNEARTDLVVSYQAWGLNLIDSGPNIFARGGVPYVTILGDDIMYHTKRLRFASDGCAVLVMGAAQIDAARQLLGPRIPVGLFSRAPAPLATNAPRLDERPVDLLFLGSVGDPDEARRRLLAEWPQHRRLLEEFLESAASGVFETTEAAMLAALERRGAHRKEGGWLGFGQWVERIDRIERARRRIAFLLGVKETRLTVWGEGWDRVPFGANVSVKSAGFPTGAAAARQAKLLLNVFPDRSFSAHDRLYLATAQGCVLLSETTSAFEAVIAGYAFAPRFASAGVIDGIADELLRNESRLNECLLEQIRHHGSFAADAAVTSILGLAEQSRLLNPTKFHPGIRF